MTRRLLALVLLFGCLSYAAIPPSVQWEVRSTGSDNNGGGFLQGASGTDFSQQDAAQFSGVDLASTNATTTCVVTSATHNFVAADVGNIIHITAGTNWTASWYSISSVAANAATLDRACGSVAAVTGGTWFEGGGLALPQTAATNLDTPGIVGLAGGSFSGTMNIKTATYTFTSSFATSINYSYQVIGYNTTHGDDVVPGPTLTTATNGINLVTHQGHNQWFDNLILQSTAGAPGPCFDAETGGILNIRNTSFSGCSAGMRTTATVLTLLNCEIKNSTGNGIDGLTSGEIIVIGSWIHNNASAGISTSTTTEVLVVNSIISNNTASHGVVTATSIPICINSTLANNGGDGWRISTISTLDNCIMYGNGGFGVDAIAGSFNTIGRNNAYGANTSGARSGMGALPSNPPNTNASLGDVTLTANPFISATNFGPNTSGGGGTAVKGAGSPGVFPGGLTTGVLNIGAVQTGSAGASCTGACKIR